ncbi:MAG: TIGR02281 family clan AA aspartic protease [Methylobacteriaceae bacterium]|nr:TIGR02281 family clan AA aspartic protease [Methylobacteriaceae bacterium]
MQAILKAAGGLIAVAVAGAYVLSERVARPSQGATATATQQRAAVAAPAAPPKPTGATVVLKAGRGGHYEAGFDVNGRRISMLVDTGASVVALSHEDALKVGLTPFPSDYTIPMSTANGVIKAARKTLSEVRIDSIVVRDVAAVVMPPGAMQGSLLGMSFLQRLSGFEIVGGDRLYLKP